MEHWNLLVVGLTLSGVCAVLIWYCASTSATRWRLRRRGIDPGTPIDRQSEAESEAYGRYLTAQSLLAVPTAVAGLVALVLLTIVWKDAPWVVAAGAVGWIGWMLNDQRLRRRA